MGVYQKEDPMGSCSVTTRQAVLWLRRALRPRPRFLAPFLPLLAPSPPRADPCRRGPDPPGFSWSPLFSLRETTCHDCSHLALFSASGFQLKTTADIKPRKDTRRRNSTPVGKEALWEPTRCPQLPTGPLWKHSCRGGERPRPPGLGQGAQHRAPRALGPLCPTGGVRSAAHAPGPWDVPHREERRPKPWILGAVGAAWRAWGASVLTNVPSLCAAGRGVSLHLLLSSAVDQNHSCEVW